MLIAGINNFYLCDEKFQRYNNYLNFCYLNYYYFHMCSLEFLHESFFSFYIINAAYNSCKIYFRIHVAFLSLSLHVAHKMTFMARL